LINGLYYNYYNFLRIKLLLNKYSFYKFLINLLLQSVYNPISSTIFSIMSVNATETCLINIETFGTFLKVVQGLVKAEDSWPRGPGFKPPLQRPFFNFCLKNKKEGKKDRKNQTDSIKSCCWLDIKAAYKCLWKNVFKNFSG
jgi:hypothetical protein